ncbi:Uri superfamily endonuclease [Methanonatronarchaeum thermophilum]|uniref:Uri superfamily endonuclease n=1 Tax=Methanonatronarchaeum thermophilum TaxID=1927129 RepID=A0A1Y3GEH5_9EURY|nr:GIY-YIG nuclease family protein [Methanonatronarchaeum thermophilum]OUJ18703.1 Uri superfamily endonuclease [Methanonatronarchaeum thermophilum]
MDLSQKGIYTLIIKANETTQVVGAIGELQFDGVYLYIGSALGPGGLKRIKRHQEIAVGIRDVERWHIDYLLSKADLVGYAFSFTERDVECKIAGALDTNKSVQKFGCSDCKCESHLFKTKNLGEGVNKIKKAYTNNNLKPEIKLLDDEIENDKEN